MKKNVAVIDYCEITTNSNSLFDAIGDWEDAIEMPIEFGRIGNEEKLIPIIDYNIGKMNMTKFIRIKYDTYSCSHFVTHHKNLRFSQNEIYHFYKNDRCDFFDKDKIKAFMEEKELDVLLIPLINSNFEKIAGMSYNHNNLYSYVYETLRKPKLQQGIEKYIEMLVNECGLRTYLTDMLGY